MADDQFVTVFVNYLGDKKYQPTLPDGSKLYTVYGYDYSSSEWHPYGSGREEPKLYKSKSRAIRVARRRFKRKQKRKAEIYYETNLG